MTADERRAMLEGVMTAVERLGRDAIVEGYYQSAAAVDVEQAAVAFAIAVLEAAIHADGPLVSALAIEWQGWRSLAEELR